MTETIKNLFANFSSRAWSALLSLILVPFYVQLIGLDGYGLIGLYTTIYLCLAPFDFGLGAAMKKEMACAQALNSCPNHTATFARTIEIIFWATGLALGILFLIASPFISNDWQTIRSPLCLMSVALAIQWSIGFYTVGLIGLQKQVRLNVLTALFASFNGIGCLIVLKYISPSIEAYFSWQIIVHSLQALSLYFLMWKEIPKPLLRPKFSYKILKEVKQFAIGMSGITLTSVILMNLDRLILSKILPLDQFGLFILSTTLAKSINLLTTPFYVSYFPALSQASILNDEKKLSAIYHQGCQFLSLILLPTGFLLVIFSREIFGIWLGDQFISDDLCLIASVYTLGSMMNGIMTMPFALQVSSGWTSLALYQNIGAICLLTPLLFFMTLKMGGLGASIVWLILNLSYLVITIPIVHSRLLKYEMKTWYVDDVGKPFLVSFLITFAGKFLFHLPVNKGIQLLFLSTLFICSFLISYKLKPKLRYA